MPSEADQKKALEIITGAFSRIEAMGLKPQLEFGAKFSKVSEISPNYFSFAELPPDHKPSVVWLPAGMNDYDPAQIYSSGLEFCFVSDDNRQASIFVYCKDFLHDAIMATHYNMSVEAHGFKYDAVKGVPLDMEHTRISLANSSDPDFLSHLPNVVDFINQIEADLHMKRTAVKEVKNPPQKYKSGVALFTSSNRWMLSPPLISAYSLLLRVGFTHKMGQTYQETMKKLLDKETKPYQKNDAKYLAEAYSGIMTIIQNGYAKIFYKNAKQNYPEMDVYDMHECMGIVQFSKGVTKEYVEHWHREDVKQYVGTAAETAKLNDVAIEDEEEDW